MADLLSNVQKKSLQESPHDLASEPLLLDSLRRLKANLPAMDKQIRQFDKLPKAEKTKVADEVQSTLFNEYMILRQFGSGSVSPGAYANEVPKDMASVFGYLAGQRTSSGDSSRLRQMNKLLMKRLVAEDNGKLEEGTIWDRPESKPIVKEVQRLWGEVKPKLDQLLADPRVNDAIRRSDDQALLHNNFGKWLEKHKNDGQQQVVPSSPVPQKKKIA